MTYKYSGEIPKKIIFFLIGCFMVIYGCQCNKSNKKVNVSGIDLVVDVRHFWKDLFATSDNPVETTAIIKSLQTKYPDFMPFYLTEIMGFGDYEKHPELVEERLTAYLNDIYVQEVYDSCLLLYHNFDPVIQDLENSLKHFKYYFPGKSIPGIITFISNFGWSNITYDSTILGIGIDMYLGSRFKYYQDLFPKYMYEKFTSEYMVANSMKVLASLNFNVEPTDNQLISHMVSKGIILYFLDLVLPDSEDHLKIGYKAEDIIWCEMNEPEIWKFFVDRELLFSSEMKKNTKFVTPGPSTTGMPPESPGDIGSWVGWQIVRAFMKKNPELSFEDLITKFDAKQILLKSNYKPKRSLL